MSTQRRTVSSFFSTATTGNTNFAGESSGTGSMMPSLLRSATASSTFFRMWNGILRYGWACGKAFS